jgi:nitrogenase iron protein NifH
MNASYGKQIVDDFATRTGTRVVEYVPRSFTVTQAELRGKTVVEAFPDSDQAAVYNRLAERIIAHERSEIPCPMDERELRAWAGVWAEHLLAMEDAPKSQGAYI